MSTTKVRKNSKALNAEIENALFNDVERWELFFTSHWKQTIAVAIAAVLAVTAAFYPVALQTAAARRDASGLVEYLLNLAKAFNAFYRECPVLAAPEPELAAVRLAMSEAVGKILEDGLHTLTIGVPEAM